MLFSSENNCNSNIETIIKDKITLSNNNINNKLINTNLNNNYNLNQSLTSKLDKQNNFKFNQNANYLQNQLWLRSPCRTNLNNVDRLQFPFETENAKELIQQKILDNAIIAQKIKEQNQELAHFLANIDEKIQINNKDQELAHFLANIDEKIQINNEDQENKNNVLLSPIDLELLSKNSSNLLLENSVNVNVNNNSYINQNVNVNNNSYINPNVTINPLVTPEQSIINEDTLLLNSSIYSPESISGNKFLLNSNDKKNNETLNLEDILNGNQNTFLTTSNAIPYIPSPETTTANTLPYMPTPETTTDNTFPYMPTPETTILSSPLTNNIVSSPESNILSSPELYDNFNISFPEYNINNSSNVMNNFTIDNYLINQEIMKIQQENLMNSKLFDNNLFENVQTPVESNTLVDNLLASSTESTPELINQPLEISEADVLKNLEEDSDNGKECNSKRKIEFEFDEVESKKKKSKKESVINEGKPFIYVITESDDENENENSGSDDDSQKKKKYKKKYYVCSVCNHKSKRHYNVEVHLKTHEKNRPRPFECEKCKKSFCRFHDLERHKIIHKEKMFTCDLCGKKFGRLDSLKRHIGCKTCVKRQQSIKNEM